MSKKRPPNVFVFMSDQERADVVKKGHPCKTPIAEKLAEEGLLFDRCYTPTAHSCPARASYFTGLYPSHHGIYNNILTHTNIAGAINPGCRMFSENLRAAGWNLGHTGKWHCSRTENPSNRGWEEVASNSLATNKTTPEAFWAGALKNAAPESDEPRRRGEILTPGYRRRFLYGATDKKLEDQHDYQVVMKAIQAMERYAKQDKPFFIHCGPTNPHDPYIIPEKYAKMYDPRSVALPPNYNDSLEDKPRLYQRQRKQLWAQLTADEVRESIAHYWGNCTLVDDLRKLVYDAIDALGVRDNTILIFMSDHGDYLGAHGLYCKGAPSFDEAQRVPLIVRWPEGIEKPGRVIDEFVTLCDFAPTFLEIAGLEQNRTSGASFAPFFHSSRVDGWTQEFHSQFNGVELYYTQRFVQTREYKYVFNGFDFDELYDLKSDPYEMKNVGEEPNYQDIKLDLAKRMWKFAYREKDVIGNAYFTVALAPVGPNAAMLELAREQAAKK
ncbi:MAG: sulfatase-like hydrolase/transferase [Candidatus Sumerlaeota bacterium]|nr:sulfatase-like hydrolase/transferase [Candidatus Sumerlaeota bacterium]